MEDTRQEVLKRLKDAADLFVSNPRSHLLIPEIRTNLGYAIPNANSVEDVGAIPGRITCAFGKSFYCMPPQFGASDHIARVILTAMRYDPNFRSAIDLRYYLSIVKSLPKNEVCVFNRAVESQQSREKERHTMNLMVEFCYKEWGGRSHHFIVDEGDVGKERTIFVIGEEPVDVVKRSLSLLDLI